MGQDIFVGIICVLALAAGVWGWWVDNGSSFKKKEKEKTVDECEEVCNEKN